MVSWSAVCASAPDFAAGVRAVFEQGRHKTIATVRADGSPRISGIEIGFMDGEVTFGSMPGSRKGADLLREPRLALHSPSSDPPSDAPSGWQGDAKISGRAVLVQDPAEPQPGQSFRVDIDEVVRIRVGDPADHLVIELWRPGQGVHTFTRY